MRAILPLLLAIFLGLTACSPAPAPAAGAAPLPTCARTSTPAPAPAKGTTAKEGWRMIATLADNTTLNDVVALEDGTVWVVGTKSLPPEPHCPTAVGVVWRNDGTTWQEIPAPACAETLTQVTASPEGTVWVTGKNEGKPVIGGFVTEPPCMARWNGGDGAAGKWAETKLEGEPGTAAATAGDELWLLTRLEQQERSVLTQWTAGRPSIRKLEMEPAAVAAGGDGEVWVAGTRPGAEEDHSAKRWAPRLARWDGVRWHDLPSPQIPLPRIPYADQYEPQPSLSISDLAVLGPREVWVAGQLVWCGQDCDDFHVQPLLMRWNGSGWSWRFGAAEDEPQGRELVPDGRGGLWLNNWPARRLTHVSGRQRTTLRLPADLAAIARQPDSTTVWGVGNDDGLAVVWTTGRDT
ncbi:hypothetical protein ACGFNP_43640 [Nonomuraea sp. NPDC049269]|uniref:hypothetical protein n=1 Tax=Nonomuraea sp. NPDC049269 TaxID=3364349 RepID=UPI003713AB96